MNNDNANTDIIDEEDFLPIAERHIGDRIRHVLTIYPRLSMSMLQVGIGTALTPKLWHPVLDKMKEAGEITQDTIQATTPTGRVQVYQVISLRESKDAA